MCGIEGIGSNISNILIEPAKVTNLQVDEVIRMSNITLFMGAGASKAFGLPLTYEILPLIMKKLSDRTLFSGNIVDCKELGNFIFRLMPGLKSEAVYPLITDILSLIDHMINHYNVPWLFEKQKDLSYYRTFLERAIFEVLDVPSFKYNNYYIPEALKKYLNYIQSLVEKYTLTIITTNYDIVFETQLFKWIKNRMKHSDDMTVYRCVDFGFNCRSPFSDSIIKQPTSPDIAFYKLHGSMNWLKCELCNHIYINVYGSIYQQAFRQETDDHNTCDCGNSPLKCVIVAPSLERNICDTDLLSIWNNSLEALRVSDEWIFIGYSMPQEDLVIKSMLIRAYNGRITKPGITVVQKGDEAEKRFALLFGQYSYYREGLEAFLDSECTEI